MRNPLLRKFLKEALRFLMICAVAVGIGALFFYYLLPYVSCNYYGAC